MTSIITAVMTLGDLSLEMRFIQRDGVRQSQVPLFWVRHPLSLCENNSFFPYPAMDIYLSLFCLRKCLFSKQSPEAALGNRPHTEMEWGVSYLLWVPTSPLCLGMQEGLGTAGPQYPQEGAPSAADLQRWKSPAPSVKVQWEQYILSISRNQGNVILCSLLLKAHTSFASLTTAAH